MSAERSKKLSFLLRHKPEAASLTLDKEGWCEVSQLVANTDFTVTELESIVAQDSKGRYAMRDGRIRANQGHSTDEVKMTFTKKVPPTVLYHGTPNGKVPVIMKEGLKPMKRHHVHLSQDTETASVVGKRRGEFTVLTVDAKQMLADGYEFFLSENNVWLVDAVPPKYLK